MIAGFLLGVSRMMHDFWSVNDEQQRMQEFVNFTKNMALLGSSFLLAASRIVAGGDAAAHKPLADGGLRR